jgi:RNA polymerase sigma factor (sigma-70 family)
MATPATLSRARTGDAEAFRELTDPYRRERQLHCYRILGSIQDAEDLLQETLLAAWRGLDKFEERSSLRSWLYRIATNRCLNALRDVQRRPLDSRPDLPRPTRIGEPLWLEPYPDAMLEGIADVAPGPEARYETKEAVALAFVSANRERAPLPRSARERELLAKFAEAFEAGDIDAVVALLTDDALLTMPPEPLEYEGHAAIGAFLADRFGTHTGRRVRLVPTRANDQPAYGHYIEDGHAPVDRCSGVLVLTLEGDRVSAITRFGDTAVMARFGLPRTMPRS